MFAGSIASFTVLGAPDLIVLTLTEFAEQAYRINRAGKLPLLVDANRGYGNALNSSRKCVSLKSGPAQIQTYVQRYFTNVPIRVGQGRQPQVVRHQR
jgi:hypothetical protein